MKNFVSRDINYEVIVEHQSHAASVGLNVLINSSLFTWRYGNESNFAVIGTFCVIMKFISFPWQCSHASYCACKESEYCHHYFQWPKFINLMHRDRMYLNYYIRQRFIHTLNIVIFNVCNVLNIVIFNVWIKCFIVCRLSGNNLYCV